ncbi:MAG: hypothetical protein J7M08_07370 [Planctomycetes bacterium]|nr:hypothetical protein [Planctomycetota bacterium]
MPTSTQKMTSRERVLAAVRRQPMDHLPLCFEGVGHTWVEFVSRLYPDPFERARFYLDLDVDTAVNLGNLPLSTAGFEVKEWQEHPADEPCPLLVKEYITPRGSLRQVVRKTEDYPHASVPLMSDHHVPPSRSVQYLVEKEEDLGKLEYIFRPPDDEELRAYYRQAKEARKFCDDHGILLTARLPGVGDVLIWLSGIVPVLLTAMDEPGFIQRYVNIISSWDMANLERHIDAGVDLVIRRGWYEGTDFWSPRLFREFLFDPLKREIEVAHQAGVLFTYIMNSGAMPLLDMFVELGLDIHGCVDPLAGNTDLARMKREEGGRITLYGGVNNNLVVERGSTEQVREGVRQAAETLAPGGGYIMGTGDSVMCADQTARRNFYEMINAWKELRDAFGQTKGA